MIYRKRLFELMRAITSSWLCLFGLTNALSTFQALMNQVFRPFLHRFILVFFDDILIYSSDIDSHVTHLSVVFNILRENELYVNLKKCQFA